MGWLVLAAGFGSRFGSDKLLAPFHNGLSVFECTLQPLLATKLPIVVVVRPEQTQVQTLCAVHPVAVCISAQAKLGMGHSLADGIRHVQPHWTWAGVVLADMPTIQATTYASLAAKATASTIVRPRLKSANGDSQPGHPVCFGRDFFHEFTKLSGDQGARTLINQTRDALVELPTDDVGVIHDVDTPKDLADLLCFTRF